MGEIHSFLSFYAKIGKNSLVVLKILAYYTSKCKNITKKRSFTELWASFVVKNRFLV